MTRSTPRPSAALLALSFGAALVLPLVASGCGEGDTPGAATGINPGTDDRAKEQKEMDDAMQNFGKAKGKGRASRRS